MASPALGFQACSLARSLWPGLSVAGGGQGSPGSWKMGTRLGMRVPSVGHGQNGLKGQCGAGAISDHSSGTETTSVAQVTWKAVAELPLTPVHNGIAGCCLSYRFIFHHAEFRFRYKYCVGSRGSVQLVWQLLWTSWGSGAVPRGCVLLQLLGSHSYLPSSEHHKEGQKLLRNSLSPSPFLPMMSNSLNHFHPEGLSILLWGLPAIKYLLGVWSAQSQSFCTVFLFTCFHWDFFQRHLQPWRVCVWRSCSNWGSCRALCCPERHEGGRNMA